MRKHQGQVQAFSRLRITFSGITRAVFKLTQSVCHICLQAVHFSFREDSLLCWQGHFPSCILADFVGILEIFLVVSVTLISTLESSKSATSVAG